jgi:predicted PurR-regulated permease PerM
VRDEAVPYWLRVAAAYSWRFLVVAGAVGVVGFVLNELRLVVLPVIVALLLCTVLVPPTRWLRRRGVPALAATLAVLGLSALVLAGIGAGIAPSLADEFRDLGTDVEGGVDEVSDWLTEGPLNLSESQVARWRASSERALEENRGALVGGALSGAVVFFEVVAGLLLALVLVFFFVKDGESIWTKFVGLFPLAKRGHVRELGERSWQTMTAYLRGIALVAFVDTVLIGIALIVLGVPLVVPLMVLTFFGAFFPLVGAFVAGAVAALVALVSEGVVTALIVVAVITIIQQLEGDFLYPVVVGRAMRLHPVAILLALTVGAVIAGVVGAFVAVPVAAVAAAIAAYVRETSQESAAARAIIRPQLDDDHPPSTRAPESGA